MDNNDERLWLSAERGAIGSRYFLTLAGGSGSRSFGTIHKLAGGGWSWDVDLGTDAGQRRIGEATSAEDASERQFDALCEIDPARFQRLAA